MRSLTFETTEPLKHALQASEIHNIDSIEHGTGSVMQRIYCLYVGCLPSAHLHGSFTRLRTTICPLYNSLIVRSLASTYVPLGLYMV